MRDKYLEQSEQDFYYYYHLIGIPISSCLFAYNYICVRCVCGVAAAEAAPACNRLPAAEYSKCI